VVVRVVSSYDANTRKLSVRFSGIDPNTNDYYQEGFLPPNTNPPQGEGAVRFRIRPRNDAESGTVIANRASIIFDPHLGANPPIVTNTHTLTLDKQAPEHRAGDAQQHDAADHESDPALERDRRRFGRGGGGDLGAGGQQRAAHWTDQRYRRAHRIGHSDDSRPTLRR
jgi:hypothetical protein